MLNPPYAVANEVNTEAGGPGALHNKTIGVLAQHFGNISDYNAHNLYGLAEAKATFAALQEILGEDRRPFIITRYTVTCMVWRACACVCVRV